jgi:hypothetical protein
MLVRFKKKQAEAEQKLQEEMKNEEFDEDRIDSEDETMEDAERTKIPDQDPFV